MDKLFWFCVDLIYRISNITGLTYEEVNIWLFVIIHPLISIILLILCVRYIKLYRKLKK